MHKMVSFQVSYYFVSGVEFGILNFIFGRLNVIDRPVLKFVILRLWRT